MKHLVLALFFSINLCMKKGESFDKLLEINTNSLGKFDEVAFPDSEDERPVQQVANRQQPQVQQVARQYPSQQVSNQQPQVRQATRLGAHLQNTIQQQLEVQSQQIYPETVKKNDQEGARQSAQRATLQVLNQQKNGNIISGDHPPVMMSDSAVEYRIGLRDNLHCPEDQELIEKLYQAQKFRTENDCSMKKLNYLGKLSTFKICKIYVELRPSNEEIGAEIKSMLHVADLGAGNFIKYKQCNYGYIGTQYYVALALEEVDDSLMYSKQNPQSKGYLLHQKVPLVERLKMYRDLFFTLEELHQSNMVHRNIKPYNLLNKIGLENYDIRKKTSYRIIIGNLSLLESTKQHGKINGTLNYLHPHLFTSQSRLIEDYLDIYALALSLIEISTYKQNQHDHFDFFGDYLQNIDSVKKQSLVVIQEFMATEFSKFKQRIAKMINLTDQQVQDIKTVLAESMEVTNPDQHFNAGIRSICKNNPECVLFAALNFNINYIPDAHFFKETLNSMISNQINLRMI